MARKTNNLKQVIAAEVKLTKLIKQFGAKLNLDQGILVNKISANKSPKNTKIYGKLGSLANLFAGLILFPAIEETDYSNVPALKNQVMNMKIGNFKIDDELISIAEYLRETKGRLPFLNTEDATIVESIEPDEESYNNAIELFLEHIGIDPELNKTNFSIFNAMVQTELSKAQKAQQELIEALEEI